MEWLNYVLSILSGLAVVIPLVLELVKYVKKSIKEKNWPEMVEFVIELMTTAEGKFTTGEERKEWVMAMVKASADTIDYDIDLNVVSKMIDDLCAMTKSVNIFSDKSKIEK